MKATWEILHKVFFRQIFHRFWLALATLLLNLVGAALEGTSFWFILMAMNLLGGASSSLPISLPIQFDLSKEVMFTVSILCAIFTQVTRSGCNFAGQQLSAIIGTDLQMYLQRAIYTQILRLSFSCANRYKVGDLIEYSRAPVTAQTIVDNFNKMLVSFLSLAALFATMFFLSPSLTLLSVLIFGVLGFCQKEVIRKLTNHSGKLVHYLVDFTRDMTQTLHGLRAIHIYNRQQESLERTTAVLDQIAKITKKMSILLNLTPFINESSGVIIVGVFLILGQLLSGDPHSLPVLLTFVIIAYRSNGKLQALLSHMSGVAFSWGQVVRIHEIMDASDKEFITHEGLSFTQLKQGIEFRNVSLIYPGRKTSAIDQFTCKIEKGKVTALVGLSGAGKSSVLDLLLRLYDPTTGDVLVDGKPLPTFEINSWRSIFGTVSQDIFILHDTIEENIRFGLTQATHEDLIRATQMAGAHEFIEKLSEKYKTIVGERGYRLSGGEKQRLVLARALIRNPQILILDEATSSLDSRSEHLIKRALRLIQKDKTLLIVAHRLSTIMHADIILVMEEGRIKEQGTHHSLLEEKGLYASLWELQAQKSEEVVYS